ncbi:alpha/beta hydrolase [Thalassobaculum salexigens]|uniref:alpha/beta hydrolase n=1 Tax=Thalassobaculum salexigens TaxID=455360 RepID=UPI00248D3E49|nr:alpha/beta hydrolase [Thalassobaculum salexigens]
MGSVRLSLTLACLLVLAACAPQIARPGTEQVTPELVQRPFAVMEDGIRLPMRIWRPEGRAEAAVVALHGFGDYSNAFAQLGADLAAQGVTVYAADQRGFGEAPGYGMWHGRARMARDAETLVRLAKRDAPGVPVYLLGESMGGAVAMLTLSDPQTEADGAVLSAPAVWGRDWMPLVQSLSLDIMAHTVPWLPLEPRGIRLIPSDNIAMLRALARDPLFIKRPRVDAVHGLVALMDAAQAAAPELNGAILVLYGRKDELVPRRPTCAMLEALPPGRRVALYADGYHMLFRDLERAQVIADIAAWTRDPTAVLPSGEEAGAATLKRFCGG